MKMSKIVFDTKPDWTNRRRYIKYLLIFLCVMLSINILASIALAAFGKFGVSISTFFIVFCICNFAVLLGIIGSYIFQAGWENKDFLNILPGLVNSIKDDDDDDDDTMSYEDMVRGRR